MTRKLLAWAFTGLIASTSAHAALFLPPLTNNRLEFTGSAPNGHGITGWPTGHQIAPPGEGPLIQYAYTTLSGRGSGPHSAGNVNAAAGSSVAAGFANLNLALGNAGAAISDLGISFGNQVNDFTKSWNLGADVRNVNWTWNAATFVEERFYTANPGDVFLALTYQQTPIVYFGYSDIYMKLDFLAQDVVGFNNPVTAAKAGGLNAAQEGLADAFLADVQAGGGKAQMIFQIDTDPVTQVDFLFNGQAGADFSGVATLQVVPEPHHYALASGIALAGWAVYRRRKAVSESGV